MLTLHANGDLSTVTMVTSKAVTWRRIAFVSLAMLCALPGCDEQSVPPVAPVNKSKPPEPPVGRRRDESSPAAAPTSQQGNANAQYGNTPVTAPVTSPSPGTPLQVAVQLSAGVALPQSLPTGTAMAMSVDYVVQGTLPTDAKQVVWVIESAQGSVDVPVTLAAQGNLMTFVTVMKPEQGPFHSYLAVVFSDGRKEAISAKADMRTY
jgi:hypothetical protein